MGSPFHRFYPAHLAAHCGWRSCGYGEHYGDFFNHDDQADGYDADVLDERDPIRAGYRATLDWVVERSSVIAEFFRLVDEAEAELTRLGFDVVTRRFSQLPWGIAAGT